MPIISKENLRLFLKGFLADFRKIETKKLLKPRRKKRSLSFTTTTQRAKPLFTKKIFTRSRKNQNYQKIHNNPKPQHKLTMKVKVVKINIQWSLSADDCYLQNLSEINKTKSKQSRIDIKLINAQEEEEKKCIMEKVTESLASSNQIDEN